MSDKELDQLVEEYGVFEATEQGKLRCTLTGHELPHRLEDLQKYVQSKRFVSEFGMKKVLDEYGDYFENLG